MSQDFLGVGGGWELCYLLVESLGEYSAEIRAVANHGAHCCICCPSELF